MVAARSGTTTVDWRFISLRLLNADIDYDAHFPPEYEAGHTAGLRLLRVAARARAEHGRAAVGPLYAALGRAHLRRPRRPTTAPTARRERRGTREFVEPILAEAGLPAELADALDDTVVGRGDAGRDRRGPRADRQGRRHADHPLRAARTGVAFFGPVISRLPGRGRGRASCGTT